MNYINNNKRVFAENEEISNNTYETHLNNNDLIIGPSGAGKTTGYVIPNLVNRYGSYIVADTKGNLYKKFGDMFMQAGYNVQCLDFSNLKNSCSYNPLDYIDYDEDGNYNEQDIMRIASIICPIKVVRDPFWEQSAQYVIASLISYVLEELPQTEQNLISVIKLYKIIDTDTGKKLFESLKIKNNESFAVKMYELYSKTFISDRTWNCINQFVANALALFDFREAVEVFGKKSDFNFCDLGRKESILFVNLSDVDRSMDPIVNVFYSQAFQVLCRFADENPDSKLDIPVRIILDDFATNTYIPNFDKITSVIRSREISVSIILQSLTQLEALYARSQAITIINNCDHIIYLGGQDITTAEYIAYRVNKSPESILNQDIDKAYLLTRGKNAKLINKIRPDKYASLFAKNSYTKPSIKANTSTDKNMMTKEEAMEYIDLLDDELPF